MSVIEVWRKLNFGPSLVSTIKQQLYHKKWSYINLPYNVFESSMSEITVLVVSNGSDSHKTQRKWVGHILRKFTTEKSAWREAQGQLHKENPEQLSEEVDMVLSSQTKPISRDREWKQNA